MLGSVLEQEVCCGTRESTVARHAAPAAGLGLTRGELPIRELLVRCSRLVVSTPFRSED